eukprot:comp20761_c1_seq1/m.27226 comp20761_c1_seq1/g.27226  ORF comp20761_c1_seq1/g.27226 comp20761_c1_seq1/m.27226 type:complete len:255 (-) comp20761_c1_seq1:47-811(-)
MPGRGRPRKRPVEDEAGAEAKKPKVDDTEAPQEKRGRGRPRKDPSTKAPPKAPAVPGRGRGRPRKDGSAPAKKEDKPAVEEKKEDEPAAAEDKNEEVVEEKEVEVKGSGLSVGDMCPDFELQNDEGVTVKASELYGDKGIIVFMYPKANTGGCTKQAQGFKEHHPQITAAGYAVYGLSADSPKSQANWRAKYDLPFNLLCDPTLETIKKFGAFKGPKNIRRSHVVIEKGGKIKDIRIDISPGDSFKEAVATVTA